MITTTTLIRVVVLRTRVDTAEEILQLGNILGTTDDILKWSVDREDSDKVLRIETINTSTEDIMALLTANRIFCEELPD